MLRVTMLVAAITAHVLGATPAAAQELTAYRGFALESSVPEIIRIGGSRESDVRTLHERPSRIQELEWRAPFLPSDAVRADPLRTVLLRFIDNQLYLVVATYHPDRLSGLTTADLVASISAIYGPSVAVDAKAVQNLSAANLGRDATSVAQWEEPGSVLILAHTPSYQRQFQLVLLSTALGARAPTPSLPAIVMRQARCDH